MTIATAIADARDVSKYVKAVLKARNGKFTVDEPGPPLVRTNIVSNIRKAFTLRIIVTTAITGASIGIITLRFVWSQLAPSIEEASKISLGRFRIPAINTSTTKGR